MRMLRKPQIDGLDFPYRSAEVTVTCWAPGGENNNVSFLIRLYVRKHREVMRHASRPPPNQEDFGPDSVGRIRQWALLAHVYAVRIWERGYSVLFAPLLRPDGVCSVVPLTTSESLTLPQSCYPE